MSIEARTGLAILLLIVLAAGAYLLLRTDEKGRGGVRLEVGSSSSSDCFVYQAKFPQAFVSTIVVRDRPMVCFDFMGKEAFPTVTCVRMVPCEKESE